MSVIDNKILKQVSSELKTYVYLLIDPRTRMPFYVGKGRGIRFDSHFEDALAPKEDDAEGNDEPRKRRLIREIIDAGKKPEVWILRHGMAGTSEYTTVEATVIDLLMSVPVGPLPHAPLHLTEQLTNARREQARGHGIRSLQSIVDEYAAPELTTTEPLLLITLNGENHDPDHFMPEGERRTFAGYKPEWRESAIRVTVFDEIGESVRGWWSISPRSIERRGIRHVVAVHEGVTRALFEIVEDSWVDAPPRKSKTGRNINDVAFRVRTVTEGPLFDEVVGLHGHRLPMKRTQNALRYWPLGS